MVSINQTTVTVHTIKSSYLMLKWTAIVNKGSVWASNISGCGIPHISIPSFLRKHFIYHPLKKIRRTDNNSKEGHKTEN
ncbi:CLUMA_CG007691, isoform A [Clunio marinus]|uniref:CLUMA_CG007691, isoform A n=1 Tax=Clunio marinus TaxID=568069 RepID=A0A1J1I1F4_9DIPT|nr:CLUMA_CG007691, isoform A [Clunio marinus]